MASKATVSWRATMNVMPTEIAVYKPERGRRRPVDPKYAPHRRIIAQADRALRAMHPDEHYTSGLTGGGRSNASGAHRSFCPSCARPHRRGGEARGYDKSSDMHHLERAADPALD